MTSSSHDQPTYEPEAAVHTNTTTTNTTAALFDQSTSSHGGRLRCPPQLMHPVGSPPRLMPTPPQPALPSASLPFTGPSYRLACSPPPPPPLSSTSSSASPRPMPSFARITPELTMSQHPMCRGNTAHKVHELGAIPGPSTSLTNTPNSQNKLSNSSSSNAREAIRESAHNNNNSTSSGSALSHQTRPQSSPGSTAKMNGPKSDKLVMMMKSAVEGREKKTRTAVYVTNSSSQNAAATDKTAASASFSSSSSSSTARAGGGIAAIPYMSRPAFTRSESSNNNNNMAGGSSSGGNDTAGYAARPMPYCMTTTSTTPPTITTSCNTNRSITSGASPATLLLPSQPPPPPILSSSSSTNNIATAGCASLHHGSLSTAGMSSQATGQPKAFLFNTSAKLVSEDICFQGERVGQGENAATGVDGTALNKTSMSSCQSGSPEKRSSRSAAATTLRRSLPTSPPQTTGPDQFIAGSVSSCQVGASYETALRPLLHGPSPPPTAPPTQDTARSHTRLANLLNVAATTATTEKPPPLLSALQPSQDHTIKGNTTTSSSGAPQYLTVNSYDAAGQKKNTSTCSALPSPSLEGLVSYVSTTNTALTSPTEAVAATGHEGTTPCAPFTSAHRGVVDPSRGETAFAEATRNAGDSVTSSSLATTTNNNTPAASVTAMRRVKRRPASLFISPQSVPQGENGQLHFSAARSTTLLAGETADNKEPSGVLRARALSAHALYDSRNQTPAQEALDSMTRQGKETHTAPPLQPMNAFDPASQPHQALNTISFITTANPADNGMTNTQDTTSTAVQAPRQDGSSSTVQLGSPYAIIDPTTRTVMSMSDGNGAAMPHSYAPGSATSSATFSPSPMTQELPNLSSLPTLGAMPRLDLAAVYMPSSMQNHAKATQNDNDGESEVERASIPYSALRALQAAHQCSMMTSEAFRPMGNTGAFTTTVQDNLEGKATAMSGLNSETLVAGQPAMMRPLTVPPALFAASTATGMQGRAPATLQGELSKKSEREGTGMGLGIVTEHRDATAMMEQHHKQSPLLQQQYNHIRSPHFASPDSTVAASATVAHRKAVAPAPLCQDRQTQRRPRHYGRRHRRPLVRLAHDGKTLIAGDFRVCEMGCLTICNFLLLNPQHSQHHPQQQQQQQERVSNAATMPQLGEMRAGDGVALAAAMTFTVDGTSDNRGPGPLLRPERLRGMSGSSNNVRGDTIPVCANMHATLSKSDVYGEAKQAKPGPMLTRLDSGGSYVVAQAPCTTTTMNSSNKGNSNAMMMASGPHNTTTTSATTAIVPDILLRSPAPSSPAITPTSVALTPDALLCPCTSPGLLMMEEAEMDYGMTSTALPGDTPAMATITPARTRGRSGTMPENASFTLQSTSMNMPYSPITYSMDSLHYPETMTPCTSKLGRSGTATQTRRLLRAHRELIPGLPQGRFSGSLTNLVAQDAEPPLSRTLGSAPHHGIVSGNMPGTPSCLRPPSSSHHHNQQQPHAMTPLTASSAAPVLLQPQSSSTAFGSGLRVFRRCSSGGLNNYNMNNAGASGLPPQSPMSCLPAALALPSAKCTRLGSFNNTTNGNTNTASGVGLMMGSSTSMLMPSATAVSRAPTVTNASLTPHGGDTPTSCTAGPLLPQATQNTILMMSHGEDSVVAGSLLPYVDIAPEQQRQQLLSAAQHAEVNATVNTPVSRQRMMMSLQNVVRYSDLDIQLAVGEGASASVYMAIHRPTGRRLAVKRVNLEPLCLDARKAFGKSGNLFTYACDSARAQQLRYIIVRELQVLHLTYRSPFMVKVYNAFYLPDIAALDIVMEFMHYGSIDDLAKCLQRHAQREAQRRTSTIAIAGTHTDQGETNKETEGKGQYVKGPEAYSIPDAMQVRQGEHVVTGNTNRIHSSHTAEADAMSLQKNEAACSGNMQAAMPFTGVTARQLTEGTNTTLQHHASVDGPLSPDYTPNNPNAPTAAQTHNTSDAFVTAVTPVSVTHDTTQSSRNAKRPLPLALPTLTAINGSTTGSSSAGGSTPHIMPDTASPLTDKTPSVTSLPGMEEELCGVCERVVAVVGEQLLCGVRDMHARNFIHRDIKPGNVLVNEHAVVKLSDFGLSQRCSDAAGVKGRGQRRHTGSNSDNTQCHTHRGRRGGKRKKTTTPGNPPRQAHHCDGQVHVVEEDGLAGITPQHPLAADMQASGECSASQQQQQMCSSVSLIASDSTHSTSCSSSSSSSLTSMEDSSSSSSSTSSSCEADAGGKTGCNAYACECDDEEDDDEDEDDVHCSGTLNYMSPERLRGEPHGKPSDIWAVGVTLAEFAVGSYPYNLHDLTDIFDRLYRMEQPIDFAPFNARRVMPLSAVFQDFIRLATLAAPSERPTAHELLEHPFFKQWSTPFDLKSYLAARVPAPETKKRGS